MRRNKTGKTTSRKARKISKWRIRQIERTVANDRSYKRVVYNRFLIFAVSVLFQISLYVLLLLEITNRGGVWLQFAFTLLSVIAVVYILNVEERPSSRINWIILILAFPIVGIAMYTSFGNGRPTRRMYGKVQAAKKARDGLLQSDARAEKYIENGGRKYAVGKFLKSVANYPAYADGRVTYYSTGEATFEAMIEAAEKAERFILVEYFIIAGGKMWERLLKVLLKKAEQGVQIRIVYDDFGSIFVLPPKYERYLEALHENVRAMAFNNVIPVFAVRLNNRDHRKIFVVDGKVAFTGGVNIADEYIGEKIRFGHWKDAGVKVTGSAVNSFTVMFFDLWNAFYREKEDVAAYLLNETYPQADGILQPYDDSPLDKLGTGEAVYAELAACAEKYLYVFTPYLILDDYLRSALCGAALRGVDVRIVTPGIPDKKTAFRLTRANYAPLLRAGVKIYEYTPGFIHSKCFVCDDEIAVVGTINLDYRSLYHHFENAVLFTDKTAVRAVKKDAEETFAVSKLRTVENTKRSAVGRLFDSVLRIFEWIF
ncbi:MAG: cardiolipin synthase [Clostridia bacterium]|nr:cardiolipin synthase [Clostridia bacterium]